MASSLALMGVQVSCLESSPGIPSRFAFLDSDDSWDFDIVGDVVDLVKDPCSGSLTVCRFKSHLNPNVSRLVASPGYG
ncbi:MAG: hypothetical protein WBD20_21710, partial [Pirellulaceae bacterium]